MPKLARFFPFGMCGLEEIFGVRGLTAQERVSLVASRHSANPTSLRDLSATLRAGRGPGQKSDDFLMPGFVVSHPFAKCAKGWGTRLLLPVQAHKEYCVLRVIASESKP